jgi:hypothetical protein
VGIPKKEMRMQWGLLSIEGMAGAPKKSRQSSKTSKPKAEKRLLLPREEWDFGSVAEVDLPACYLWEYWREKCHRDSSTADALNGLRKDVRADDNAIRRHDQRDLSLFRHLVETKAPGITEAHAESLIFHGKFNLYLLSDINPLSTKMNGLANISEEYFPCRAFQSLDPVAKQIVRGRVTLGDRRNQPPPLREVCIPSTPTQVQPLQMTDAVSFQVYWDYTDELIREAFSQWLVQRRAGRKPRLTNGLGPGKSIAKTLLRDLKALGALRLQTYYGSASDASRAIEETNFSLLADKSSWSKYKKLAEKRLQDLSLLPD